MRQWKQSVCVLAALASLTAFRADAAPIPWKLPLYTLVARDMDLRVALDTFAVPLGDLPESMFFKVKVKEN